MRARESKAGQWRWCVAATVVVVAAGCSILAYSAFVTVLVLRQPHATTSHSGGRPPYLPISLDDLFDLITVTTANCSHPLLVPGASVTEKEDRELSGHEGTYICLDALPATPTQDSCRMYSFGVNRNDIKFEKAMARRGCRMHLVIDKTEYSYTRLSTNIYLYPLELATNPGLGKYTLDSFLDLLTHVWKPIHYVKTTTQGTEWTFLRSLYTSGFEAYSHFKQIRLLLHLPLAADDKIEELKELYHLLLGLEYYGYRLIYSRPIPGTTYFIYNSQRHVATKYETVWIRTEE